MWHGDAARSRGPDRATRQHAHQVGGRHFQTAGRWHRGSELQRRAAHQSQALKSDWQAAQCFAAQGMQAERSSLGPPCQGSEEEPAQTVHTSGLPGAQVVLRGAGNGEAGPASSRCQLTVQGGQGGATCCMHAAGFRPRPVPASCTAACLLCSQLAVAAVGPCRGSAVLLFSPPDHTPAPSTPPVLCRALAARLVRHHCVACVAGVAGVGTLGALGAAL